ncbi:phage tail protein [Thalassococcus sp. BH17M4-6]|uniref:phage tail protein n=1 Tax=Thalassococcus sp. BH17M4-6 TaxID=3413148 RepID=UPI003BBCCA66
MPPGDRVDPLLQINFLLEIDGITRGAFTEVSGLTAEQETVDYREGSEDTVVRKLPGLKTFTNIMLKRGWTQDAELWEWRKTTIDGVTERKAGAIIVLDEARQEALRFSFREGWICKWEGPQLNSTTNEVAIESIEICHEGLEMVT